MGGLLFGGCFFSFLDLWVLGHLCASTTVLLDFPYIRGTGVKQF